MNRQRAQTLVEFACVFPVFLLLVLCLLDIGRAVWYYNSIAFVARDTARQLELAGSINPSLATCNALFLEGCSTATPPPAGKIAVTGQCPTPPSTTPPPAVSVTYTFQPLIATVMNFPWVQTVAPGSGTFQLTATSVVPFVPGVCS